jgi:predicted metal-dependent phosphoesterase TrpH
MLIPDKSRCDLHVHSNFSDGADSPSQLIAKAEAEYIRAVALTDHNTIGGVQDFLSAAENSKVIGVPGIEFTTEYNGIELHILGLFLKPDTYNEIENYAGQQLMRKEKSNEECVERLCRGGYCISYDKIKADNPDTSINRVHIAKELMDKGYIKSISEAFEGLLSTKGSFYMEPEKLSSLETINSIRNWGAAAVWAHPFLNMDETHIKEFIPRAIDCGLCGVETCYPLHTADQTQFLKELCSEKGLLESGGSDYHGDNKPDISIGMGTGGLFIEGYIYNRLYEYSLKQR